MRNIYLRHIMKRCIKQRHLFTLIFAIWLVKAMALEVTLPAAGTLKDYITPEQQETVTKLKVSGDINGDDLRIIRHMIGAKLSSDDSGKYPEVDSGACRVLDLSEANIIGEGFYTYEYVSKPKQGPPYYLPGLPVEANKITYAMFCGFNLRTLILPNSVTYIGCTHYGATTADHCIDGSHLKSVTLPANLEHMVVFGTGEALIHRDEGPDYYGELPQSNLLWSPNLAEVKIDESNPNFKIIDGVLYSGDLTELQLCPPKREGTLEIPAETKKIGYRGCFYTHITNDLHITVPDIGSNAFNGVTIDGNLSFGNEVKVIPEKAFYSATINNDFTFDCDFVEIGKDAFKLLTVMGNFKFTGIGNLDINKECFINCTIGKDLIVSGEVYPDAFAFSTLNGNLVLADGLTAVHERAFACLKGNEYNITFPSTLTTIGTKAFVSANVVGTLVVPESVISMGGGAFHNNNFTEVKLNAVTKFDYIGEIMQDESISYFDDLTISADNVFGAFSKSNLLTSIDIPADMTEIPAWIFKDSPNLTSINVPNPCALSVVGEGAFWGCAGLTELQLPQTKEGITIKNYAFWLPYIKARKRTVYVPMGLSPAGDYYTAVDDIYLWYDPNNIETTPVIYSHWYAYGEQYDAFTYDKYSSELAFTDKAPDYIYVQAGEPPFGWARRYVLGKLYIPKGSKEKLRSFLQSKIIYLKESSPIPYRKYPLLLYIPENNWIEIDMYDYPYCELNPYPGGVEQVGSSTSNAIEVARYDIFGKRLDKQQQGINIIVYSDGTAEKVYIK